MSKHTLGRIHLPLMFAHGEDGQDHRAHIRVRKIYCGRHCKSCPHGFYKYLTYRSGGKVKSKYLGKVTAEDVKEWGLKGFKFGGQWLGMVKSLKS